MNDVWPESRHGISDPRYECGIELPGAFSGNDVDARSSQVAGPRVIGRNAWTSTA